MKIDAANKRQKVDVSWIQINITFWANLYPIYAKNEQNPIDMELDFKVIDYACNFKIDLCSTYFLKSCLVWVLSLNLVYISWFIT